MIQCQKITKRKGRKKTKKVAYALSTKKLRGCVYAKARKKKQKTARGQRTQQFARSPFYSSGRVQLQTDYLGSISQERFAVRRPHGNRPHELCFVRGNHSSYLPITSSTLLVNQQDNVAHTNISFLRPPLWASLKRRHIIT